MLLNVILLSISSSIDSFGIGITYGLRKLKIACMSKFILFVISITITYIAILIGKNLSLFLSPVITKFFGAFILIFIGTIIIFQLMNPKNNNISNTINYDFSKGKSICIEEKVYNFFIKFLGITIQIIKNPIYSDFDTSSKIDTKEAIYLGFSLSIDSFCIGVASSILGLGYIIFPILVAIFQIIFLSIGTKIGSKLSKFSKIPDNIWNLISAILLILIGITRLFF